MSAALGDIRFKQTLDSITTQTKSVGIQPMRSTDQYDEVLVGAEIDKDAQIINLK